MKTKKEYIDILKLHVPELKNQFGIRSFRLFGSVARDEQQDDSDVDVCVEMDPDLYQFVGLKQFLEKLLGCSVDVIRIHRNMNKLLMKQNEKDGIYVF
ncbi:MAG: DNA polymerase subunit beta [Parabacteroides johnsonii]|nr:DNA polymerase subunit beta [Parabacteroides johnsonii]